MLLRLLLRSAPRLLGDDAIDGALKKMIQEEEEGARRRVLEVDRRVEADDQLTLAESYALRRWAGHHLPQPEAEEEEEEEEASSSSCGSSQRIFDRTRGLDDARSLTPVRLCSSCRSFSTPGSLTGCPGLCPQGQAPGVRCIRTGGWTDTHTV